jgi:hypothetical protein
VALFGIRFFEQLHQIQPEELFERQPLALRCLLLALDRA